jgi:triosephosphate isomerase
MARKFFVGGNWKMNGTRAQLKTLVDGLNGFAFDKTKVGK